MIRNDLCNYSNLAIERTVLQVLMINLLAIQQRGVLAHACAVNDAGRGFLFLGVSGAGKSTLSRLWHQYTDANILSDDRVIVQKQGERYWAYGTPWHGDANFASPESVPIEKIFILQHGEVNQVTPVNGSKAVLMFLKRSFPTFWDPAGMDFTLKFLSDLSQSVPCYTLDFVPDASVLEYVRCLKSP